MIPNIKLAPSKMLYTWARGKLKKNFFPELSEKGAHENLSFSMWLWRGKLIMATIIMGFPGNSVAKNLSAKVGEEGSIPGLGRSPRERNGNSFQYFFFFFLFLIFYFIFKLYKLYLFCQISK